MPQLYEIWSLYSTMVFLIYGWTTIAFFWKLPSWMKILNGGEIAIVIAYILASNLLESLLLLIVFVIAAIVLPSSWLREDFAVRGGCMMYVFTFWACIFALNSLIVFPTPSELIFIAAGLLASMLLVLLSVKQTAFMRRLMRSIANRTIIFLYLWVPLSLIGAIVVLIKLIAAGSNGL